RVFGPPAHLQSLIEEFAVHGIATHRVVVGGEPDTLSGEALQEIRRVCSQRGIELEFLPRLFGLDRTKSAKTAVAAAPPFEAADPAGASIALPSYFRLKGFVDVVVALVLLILLLPIWILVASLAFLDVRPPVLFWQQRSGLNGRQFLLYKFRTLQLPFDWQGRRLDDEQRLSWIGRLLRETRLDELPQLLNVLVGDMSLVGPRPLLPQDQPSRG